MSSSFRGVRAARILAIVLASLLASSTQAARQNPLSRIIKTTEDAHPNALWHVVHGLCLRDMTASGNPAPCAEVNLDGGYAVLKDIAGKTQYLLIPTTRVTGIESASLLEANAPNYWRAAWAARRFLEHQVGHAVAREDIGLAVNSTVARTQNQLHIHIDCVKPGVARDLQRDGSAIGARWSRFHDLGRRYEVRWLADADLERTDPFKVLARRDAATRSNMGRQTLVLIGGARADGTPGFFLLSNRADGDDPAAGEELLDHGCAILHPVAPG